MISNRFRSGSALLRTAASTFAVLAVMSAGSLSVFSVAPAAAEAVVKSTKHKIRSASYVVTSLSKKGFKVNGVRRKAQVYFVKVGKGGSSAILAIDGYSAEIIGLKLLKPASGVTPKKRGSGPRHFVDVTYEFGYIIRESVYESYTLISSTEISSTEEYSFVSYSESEEVTYEEVEHDASADLDDGSAEDTAGDTEAGANNDKDDGAADDSYNANDNAADDSAASDDAASDDNSGGNDDNSASDDAGASDDGPAADDPGATDDGGGSDDSSGGNDDGGGSDDSSGGNDDGGGSDDSGGGNDGDG